MKAISIRFDDYLANWITGTAQQNRLSISAVIKDLLYEKMQDGQIIKLVTMNKASQLAVRQHYRSELGYIIFTAKLLEGLVLASNEQGAELISVAFAAAKNMLEELQLNQHKGQFCINLEPELYNWLSQEASRLQIRVTPLIRKIVAEIAVTELKIDNYQLNAAQKIGIEHQLLACKLLEILINNKIDGAAAIIEEARNKTRQMLAKLYGGSANINS